MSRRGLDVRGRDSERLGRSDAARGTRYPPCPSPRDVGRSTRYVPSPPPRNAGKGTRYPLSPPARRERIRGGSPPPHRDRLRSISPPRFHRRARGNSWSRNGQHESSPRRRRLSKSPVRSAHRKPDEGFFPIRARSPYRQGRRSLEPHPRREASRERQRSIEPHLRRASSRERNRRSPLIRARTPPPPPPLLPPPPLRSPLRMSLRPASPRVSYLSSPRLAMGPLSPRAATRPLSPQLPMHLTRIPPTRSSPQRGAVLEREIDRIAHEALMANSRNGSMLGMQSATSGIAVPGLGDLHNTQEDETISSSGLLVPQSIVLEDGTVGTFYSLPPDPLANQLPRNVDTGLGGNLLPPYNDGLAKFSSDAASLRRSSPDKYLIDRPRVDYLASQDHRFSDKILDVHKQFAMERNLPEYSTVERGRPLSPCHTGFEGPLQRRLSRSPLRGEVRGHVRDDVVGYGREMGRVSREINLEQRELGFSSQIPPREGFSSPRRRGFDEDPRRFNDADRIGYGRDLKQDEFLRMSFEGRMNSHRGAPSPPDYSRHRGPARSPDRRDRFMMETRNGSLHIPVRSPSGDGPRFGGQHRHPDQDRFGHLSPRRRRSLTPPHLRNITLYEEERRGLKRKLNDGPLLDRRPCGLYEPLFKRRERDGGSNFDDDVQDRRPTGWDRRDGWPERRDAEFARGKPFDRRGRGISPPSRRHPNIGRRENDVGVKPPMDKPRKSHVDNGQRERRERDEQQEGALDLPEDSAEFKQQVERVFLKYVKVLNEDAGEKKKYEEQGKAGTLSCLVCGRLSKTYVDTHNLVVHASESKKKGLRAEHLGLCRAICSLMGWSSAIDAAGGTAYQNVPAQDVKANREDLIIWPPAVVIHNAITTNTMDGQQDSAADSVVKELLKDAGLSVDKIKVATGRGGSVIIKYLPVLSSLHDAEHLHKHLASSSRGRDEWLHVKLAEEECKEGGAGSNNDKAENRLLYGYIALANDLDKVDLDLHRRCQIKSRKAIEAIAGEHLMDKKASD